MRDPELIDRAKAMRQQPSPFEHKLWLALRAERLNGAKFRRQVVIGRYIVDFACRIPSMLVIEVDGDAHADREAYDSHRTRFLQRLGYRVLRFTNEDVGKNFDEVLMAIQNALPLSPTLSPEGEREQVSS